MPEPHEPQPHAPENKNNSEEQIDNIAKESGEGDEIGEHDTYLIFDPNRIEIINKQKHDGNHQ